ncbi:MAG TPA: NYN domain-containing protein [Chlamydiales bacterium]|nr:NYN domain-containing protein [Chlamydiales bacterium]
MYYFIDGYNLIFSLIDSKESLKTLRQNVVRLLQKRFARYNLSGTIVFDGAHQRGEESGLSYPSPLIVAYTPKGESADEYIVEQLKSAKRVHQTIVVTDDRGLGLHVKSMGGKVQSNAEFIHWLNRKKKTKGKEIAPADTQQNIDRLLAIFEERLKRDLDE